MKVCTHSKYTRFSKTCSNFDAAEEDMILTYIHVGHFLLNAIHA